MPNKFIHCDCDCFFAAIEIRDDPSLEGLPVAVGGSASRRGVIATCNYEARKYGIHSAMASSSALKLCPDLIIIPGNMEKYKLASDLILEIFRDFTELVEPLSLDEAFLDVTDSSACKGSATLIAEAIRNRARQEVGITISAGIAPNKFLAKVASDWNKPDGLFTITPEQVEAFIRTLPVSKIPGVGKVTATRMERLGIHNCAELQAMSQSELIEQFGSFGSKLYSLSRGIDNRNIQLSRQRKSISVEKTYATDLLSLQQCLAELPSLVEKLQQRISNHRSDIRISKQFAKVKFHDFVSTTVEQSSQELSLEVFQSLLSSGFNRGNKAVRLIGIGIRLDGHLQFKQMELNFPSLHLTG